MRQTPPVATPWRVARAGGRLPVVEAGLRGLSVEVAVDDPHLR